jgi:hypothetical protein
MMRIIASLLCACVSVAASGAETLDLLSAKGTERATAGFGNKVVSRDDRIHVVYSQLSPHHTCVVQSYDKKAGRWSQPTVLSRGKDNHAAPCITVDAKGFLHVLISGHHSEIIYLRSANPNDSSKWTRLRSPGEGTYVSLVCGGDTLYAAYRQKWEGLTLAVKPLDAESWKQKRVIKKTPGKEGYAAYYSGMAWDPKSGTLHLLCDFYEGDGRQNWGDLQTLGYMRTRDGGKTWESAQGRKIDIPATSSSIDALVQESLDPVKHARHKPPTGARRQMFGGVVRSYGSIVVDSRGRPFVAYGNEIRSPGRPMLASPDNDGKWQHREILKGAGRVTIRGGSGMTIAADDTIHLTCRYHIAPNGNLAGVLWARATSPAPPKEFVVLGKWEPKPEDRATLKPTFHYSSGYLKANLERPDGANRVPAEGPSGMLFFAGNSRDGAGPNMVFWAWAPSGTGSDAP